MDNYTRRIIGDIRVIDGDTIEVEAIDLGFGVRLAHQSTPDGPALPKIRLAGIDAFEMTRRGKWDDGLSEAEVEAHIEMGHKAKSFVESMIEAADEVWVRSIEWGKFGRIIGEVFLVGPITAPDEDFMNLNEELVREGYAYWREY